MERKIIVKRPFSGVFFQGAIVMQGRFETFTVLITTINRSIRKIKTEEMAEFDLKDSVKYFV